METNNTLGIKDIFNSNSTNGSITHILGQIISTIENCYGRRDYSYTILGIELSNDGPQLLFPSNIEKGIIIQITEDCQFDIVLAVYQVAHEAVHCLSPNLFGQSTYLEEGLATYFAYQFTNQNFGTINIGSPKYLKAANLTHYLLEYNPTIIKELRELEPSISSFTKDMLIEYSQSISVDLANMLITNFQLDIQDFSNQ